MLHNPIEMLSSSLYLAALRDLPLIEESRPTRSEPARIVTRRPDVSECVVVAMFPQTWGSTALGFGGIGGQAMTDAYTVIILCGNHYAVYWNGAFAYTINQSKCTPKQLKAFETDVFEHTAASRMEAATKYEAEWPV